MAPLDFPAREALRARTVSYISLGCAAASIGSYLLIWIAGDTLLFVSMIGAALALIAGFWAVVITRHCLAPKPVTAIFSLLLGAVLVGGHVCLIAFLISLGHMH